MFFILFITASILTIIYYFSFKPYKYWISKGVIQGNPWPPFGNMWNSVLQKESIIDLVKNVYDIAPDQRYCGVYQLFKPVLVLRDADLIKQITVKDFDHFLDHDEFVPEHVDPLWGKNLFALKGDKWRNMRLTLSPSFSRSKMKFMFIFLSECAENFTNYFLKKDDPVIPVVFKDIFTKYANDVIASTAFGIKCDSLANPNNEFYLMGKELNNIGLWKNLLLTLVTVVPSIDKVFDCKLFKEKDSTFFKETIKEAIALREKGEVVRSDMIQLLVESRKNCISHEEHNSEIDTRFIPTADTYSEKNKKEHPTALTDEDIIAQAVIFFIAGFETTSSLMCLMGYELGINPDIQKKLQNEIDETLTNCKGNVTYEAVLKMKYLDMVVSETLRKWPANSIMDRKVTKQYTIPPVTSDEKPVHLDVGDIIWIPTYGIHRDHKYFPNPEKFDPERFSDQNKGNIHPYSCLTFGVGPRNCMGYRFALLETKILYFHLLSKFDIVPVQKTQIPFEIDKRSFIIAAKDGFQFGFTRKVK